MKISAFIFGFLFLGSTASPQTVSVFEVSTNQVNQGEMFKAWIQPQWQGSYVCISFMGKNYRHNEYGWVNIGIDVNSQPGKYQARLVECGRGIELALFYEEIEVLEHKFPETRTRRRLVPLNSPKRQLESSLIRMAYAWATPWKEYRDQDFIPPLDNITVTSPFGTKRIYLNAETRHGGVDLRAPNGTPVKAINSGIVLLAERNFSLEGNLVIIDHGSGVISVYLHLSGINIKQGDVIRKGDVMGLSGSTGSVTGPHLHLIVKINGVNVDPLSAIKILNQHI